MAYNRFLYNTALYNAGRDEVGAIAKSIIQAHTGPHIQAVVGEIPSGAGQSGIAFLSDFTITEGTVKKPPTSFKFPDLSAIAQPVRFVNFLASIFGVQFKDLPAAVFLVDKIPDLPAFIFALLEKDLSATIVEKLFVKIITSDEKDLPGLLQVLPAVVDLLAEITPSGGFRELGARIHAPLDLPAILEIVQRLDLPANIFAFQFADMSGFMFGQPAPVLSAQLKGFATATADLPSASSARDEFDIGASLTSSIPGPNDILSSINAEGTFNDVIGFLRTVQPGFPEDLGATIGKEVGVTFDLQAAIALLAAKTLAGTITTFPVGERDRFLPGSLQPVHPDDLGASLVTNPNLKNLTATIEALRGTEDLNAFLRVAETFVTAILTVTTLSSRSLRATVGQPECAGGSANLSLAGSLIAQQAKDMGAILDSFIEKNLGAGINTGTLIHAFDLLDVFYSRTRVRNPIFLATDTIDVLYSRFRGDNLGAVITAIAQNVDLGATLTAAFPLPSVTPFVSSLVAADLRGGEALDIQEVRLQLEGALLEYFYVNGTDLAFIRDANQTWQINVRSFRSIAEDLFGDFAAAKICRRGDVTSFATLDEAIRSCIDAVIGLQGESNVGAFIRPTGQSQLLSAFLEVNAIFGDMPAIANRVFPVDFGAILTASGSLDNLGAFVLANDSSTGDMAAFIVQQSDFDLVTLVSGSGGPPFQPNVLNAILLSAIVPQPTLISDIGATVSGTP